MERFEPWNELHSVIANLALAIAKKKECAKATLELIKDEIQDLESIQRFYDSLMVSRWFKRAEREASGNAAKHTD